MAEANYARTMSRLPDEALAEIARPGADDSYDPAAIAAAKAELDRRGVSSGDILRHASAAQTRRADDDAAVKSAGLSRTAKILFGIFAFSLPAWVFALLFTLRGYTAKSNQAWQAIGIGALVQFGFGLVLAAVFVVGDLLG